MEIISCIVLCAVVGLNAYATPDTTDVRIGLALSAGGAFGLAHIGVLKVLERENIPVCCLSSNSMGSVVGGLYAAGYSTVQIESIAVNLDWENVFDLNVKHATRYLPESRQSHRYAFRWSHDRFIPSMPVELMSLQQIEFQLMRLLAKAQYDTYYSFDSLRMPLRVIAVDLVSGCRIVIRDGRLDQAIRGSIAIPGVFAPQRAPDRLLVDGGVLQYFPVDPLLEMGPDIIIASLTFREDTTRGASLVDVMARSTSVAGFDDIRRQRSLADVVIEPDVSEFSAQDYARASEIIHAGEVAAAAMVDDIRSVIAARTPVAHYRTITPRPVPYVRSITINGLERTRRQTVMNEIATAPGMPLDFDRLVDDLEGLFNTGLFEHVDYGLSATQDDSVDLTFELREKEYGFYLFGVRYDNWDNATLGLEIGQSNVMGRGFSIRGAVTLGEPNEYRIGVSNTRMLGIPLGYTVDAFWNSIDRSLYDEGTWLNDYNIDSRGGITEVGYTLNEHTHANIGLQMYQVTYRLPVSSFFDTMPSSEWINAVSSNVAFNNYDDYYFPLRGVDYRSEFLCSIEDLGAGCDFIRLEVSGTGIIPLTNGVLLTTGFDVGASIGDMAWAKYFYTGGANFIGLKPEEYTTRQKAVLHLGVDVKTFTLFNDNNPLLLQFASNIASFEPLGDLFEENDHDLQDYELGFGVGMRANTPIGPFRIMFGVANPHRAPVDENIRYALYFSLGRDFRYTR